MPRAKVLHMNRVEDDEFAVCGKKLAKVNWTLMPAQVTCLACKKAMA